VIVKTQMQLRVMRITVGVACALLLCVASVAAQMEPGSGTRPARPADSKPSTRQQTGESESQKPAPPVSGESPAKTPVRSAGNEQPIEGTQPAPPVATDPITVLREQIDAAPTAQEKAALQLKLADLLMHTGKQQEAHSQLGQMLSEDRFDPQSFYNIGNAFARLGDIDGAVASYRKAIDQRKGRYSKALNNLAVVLMRRGEWDLANEALTSALRMENYRYAEASYNLGRLYAAQGQLDLAIREWRRALKIDPNHLAAAQAIARSGREGQVTVSSITPAPAVGDVNASAGPRNEVKAAAAPRMLRPVLVVDPMTYGLLQRAREAHERGKDQEAIGSYRTVISRMGGYFAPANLEISYILLSLKQPDEALIYLKPVTTRDGTRYPISYYHLARIYEVKDDLVHAGEAYDQVATLYRGINPQFLLDISRVREKRGDYQGALAAMEEYLKAVQQLGLKPLWSEERLAALRQKVATSK